MTDRLTADDLTALLARISGRELLRPGRQGVPRDRFASTTGSRVSTQACSRVAAESAGAPLPPPSLADNLLCLLRKLGPLPVRSGPATGVGLVFELALPEPDDIVLDLHPWASMRSGAHVAAF